MSFIAVLLVCLGSVAATPSFYSGTPQTSASWIITHLEDKIGLLPESVIQLVLLWTFPSLHVMHDFPAAAIDDHTTSSGVRSWI